MPPTSAPSVALSRCDARSIALADGTVDAVVTSIPFWQVRGYEDGDGAYEGQIGVEKTVDLWLAEMWTVMAELSRTLKKSGSIFLHVQDKWNSDTGGRNDKAAGSGTVSNDAPERSLLYIPQRLVEGCIDPDYADWRMTRAEATEEAKEQVRRHLPLIFREEIIVWRYNGMPESVHNRTRRQHEYLLHFTVNADYFADLDPIRTPQQHLEHAQIGKKHSGDRWSSDDLAEGTRRWAVEERRLDPRGTPPVSVWKIPTEPFRVPDGLVHDDERGGTVRFAANTENTRPVKVHTAVYPPRLVQQCIAGWSPTAITESGSLLTADEAALHNGPTSKALILDPFSGTGTTSLVAKALGRNSVGFDLSSDYTHLARWRTSDPSQATKILDRHNESAQNALF